MPICDKCEGRGMTTLVRDNGDRVALPCACVLKARQEKMTRLLQLPAHYQGVRLEDYKPGNNVSLFRALGEAKKYIAEYRPGVGTGLLFTGSVGTGKTHLASAILRAAAEKGATGLFCDFREVLKRVQQTFHGNSAIGEHEILRPITHADLVVLDELGAARVTDWTYDIVEHILNMRYNERRATIVTTNYPFRGPGVSVGEAAIPISSYARAQVREETLGDRIGARMYSRLCEMCKIVELQGEDYRTKCRPA